ncbi:MAG: response regulator [Chloroflexi bacterium]|nr:response regulator [Chloroflexota bacterium]
MTTLLYVEDHPPARLLMQAIIAELTDCELITAESGAAARALLTQHTPDLYIIDLDLPDTDGLALAAALTQTHAAPVILVSAYAEAIQTDQFTHSDYVYLAKPLDPDDVAAAVRRALARH